MQVEIDRNTVASGVLAGSTALAGLLVVFQGSLTATYGSLIGQSREVKGPYKWAINAALALVLLTLVVALLALATMLVVSNVQTLLFWVTVCGFVLALGLFAWLAIVATRLTS